MGREIKFRGRSKEEIVEWVYGSYVYGEQSEQHFIVTEKHIGAHNFVNVYGKSVGEFTGLLDKNGKEIYEGDVLEAMGLLTPYKINVVYDVELGAYHLAREYSRAEIIGNIHENPELLK